MVRPAPGKTGQASGEVLAASETLNKQSEVLRGEIGRFLAEIRAA